MELFTVCESDGKQQGLNNKKKTAHGWLDGEKEASWKDYQIEYIIYRQ